MIVVGELQADGQGEEALLTAVAQVAFPSGVVLRRRRRGCRVSRAAQLQQNGASRSGWYC